jgi:hypothetical protein
MELSTYEFWIHLVSKGVAPATAPADLLAYEYWLPSVNDPVGSPEGNPVGNPVGSPVGNPMGNPVGNPAANPVGQP